MQTAFATHAWARVIVPLSCSDSIYNVRAERTEQEFYLWHRHLR
jgi:hypothetical protein